MLRRPWTWLSTGFGVAPRRTLTPPLRGCGQIPIEPLRAFTGSSSHQRGGKKPPHQREDPAMSTFHEDLEHHLPDLNRFARVLTRNEDDAYDLVQDCIERGSEHGRTCSGPEDSVRDLRGTCSLQSPL